jgi:hypothetical protein
MENVRAREAGLTVEEIGDELLVFDSERQLAHSLNHVAAQVWRACDGTRTPEQIASHCELTDEVVVLALDELKAINLVAQLPEPRGEAQTRVSHRHILRRAALAGAGVGLALPIIRSVVAPSSAAAAASTCSGNGETCASASACCSAAPSCHQHGPGPTSGVCRTSSCLGLDGECVTTSDCCVGLMCTIGSDLCVPIG